MQNCYLREPLFSRNDGDSVCAKSEGESENRGERVIENSAVFVLLDTRRRSTAR